MARSQFYYSFGRSTRTILRKGSSGTRKIAILLQFRVINTHDLTKGFIGHPQDRNFTTVSGATRTILRKGSSGTRKIAILLQFRAINTHDLTKGFIGHPQDRNFTTVSGDQHARSYERVHRAPARSQFYYSFGRSTRTILRKGSSGTRKIAILLQFRAIDTHDLMRGLQVRKHFPDHGGPPPSLLN